MIDTQQVGRNMMLLRLQKRMSQQALAELCNVTHQAVSKWENGAALPDMQTMLFLSKYYQVPMEDILTGRISMDAEEPAEKETDAVLISNGQEMAAGLPPAEALTAAPASPEDASPLEDSVPVMNWKQITALAPFASQETLEALANRCSEALDEENLCKLAPFLSGTYLDRLARKLGSIRPGLVLKLAPYLPQATVDWLILGVSAGKDWEEETNDA